eukprot:NODE_28725_length_468_cov_1.604106.p1 GENE.NODE_28725_length_468_cov_1.604106~~NODE_28725_length_468_cov_1.604106.p1  ORF type:complete len:73 (-),score=9.03 NODE_28725_length_468_cov_1.604106:104-322(-)
MLPSSLPNAKPVKSDMVWVLLIHSTESELKIPDEGQCKRVAGMTKQKTMSYYHKATQAAKGCEEGKRGSAMS